MSKTGSFKIILLVILSSFILSSCLSCLKVNVKRPAPINIIGYKSVACMKIMSKNDIHGYQLTDNIQRMLLQSGEYKVLDRENILKVLRERSFGNDYYDFSPEQFSSSFKGLGAELIFTGRIIEDEMEIFDGKIIADTSKKGVITKSQQITAEYRLSMTIKCIDTQTGELISINEFNAEANDTKYIELESENRRRPKFDKDFLFNKCADKIVHDFKMAVNPFYVAANLCFEEDDAMPELERAYNLLSNNNHPAGLELLKMISEKAYPSNKVLGKAFYNLGMAHVYFGSFDDAEINLKNALQIDPYNNKYADGLNILYTEKEYYKKLTKNENK